MPPLKHGAALIYAGFSPDGRQVVTCAGSAAQVWGASTGEPVTVPLRQAGRVNSAQFSPDGKRLVTACQDGTALVWDVATGHPLTEPLRHSAKVNVAFFSPDGRNVVTASADGTARIWEVPLAPLPVPDWLPALAEAVGGQRIDERDRSTIVPVAELFALKKKLGERALEQPLRQQSQGLRTSEKSGNATGAVAPVGPFLRHENQQRVGDVRHGAEQPHYHRDGNHGRQHNGQAGEKIGAPAGEMVSFLHDRTLTVRAGLLKETEAARFMICELRFAICEPVRGRRLPGALRRIDARAFPASDSPHASSHSGRLGSNHRNRPHARHRG